MFSLFKITISRFSMIYLLSIVIWQLVDTRMFDKVKNANYLEHIL